MMSRIAIWKNVPGVLLLAILSVQAQTSLSYGPDSNALPERQIIQDSLSIHYYADSTSTDSIVDVLATGAGVVITGRRLYHDGEDKRRPDFVRKHRYDGTLVWDHGLFLMNDERLSAPRAKDVAAILDPEKEYPYFTGGYIVLGWDTNNRCPQLVSFFEGGYRLGFRNKISWPPDVITRRLYPMTNPTSYLILGSAPSGTIHGSIINYNNDVLREWEHETLRMIPFPDGFLAVDEQPDGLLDSLRWIEFDGTVSWRAIPDDSLAWSLTGTAVTPAGEFMLIGSVPHDATPVMAHLSADGEWHNLRWLKPLRGVELHPPFHWSDSVFAVTGHHSMSGLAGASEQVASGFVFSLINLSGAILEQQERDDVHIDQFLARYASASPRRHQKASIVAHGWPSSEHAPGHDRDDLVFIELDTSPPPPFGPPYPPIEVERSR